MKILLAGVPGGGTSKKKLSKRRLISYWYLISDPSVKKMYNLWI